MRFFRCTALARGRRRDRFYEAVRGLQKWESLGAFARTRPKIRDGATGRLRGPLPGVSRPARAHGFSLTTLPVAGTTQYTRGEAASIATRPGLQSWYIGLVPLAVPASETQP